MLNQKHPDLLNQDVFDDLHLCKCINEQLKIPAHGIQDRTGAAAFLVLFYLGFRLIRRP
jgi:uncharacterized membrane protein (Fun14 family)